MWISTWFSTYMSLPYIDQIHRPDPGEFSCPCFVGWERSCEEARDSPTKTQVYKSYLSLFYCYIWHFIAIYDIFIFLQLSNFLCIYHFIIFNAFLDTAFISFFTCEYLIQSYGSCEPVHFSFLRCCLPALLGETPNNHRVVICLFFSLNHCNKRSAFMGRSVQLHTWLLSRAYLCSLRYTIWVNSL